MEHVKVRKRVERETKGVGEEISGEGGGREEMSTACMLID